MKESIGPAVCVVEEPPWRPAFFPFRSTLHFSVLSRLPRQSTRSPFAAPHRSSSSRLFSFLGLLRSLSAESNNQSPSSTICFSILAKRSAIRNCSSVFCFCIVLVHSVPSSSPFFPADAAEVESPDLLGGFGPLYSCWNGAVVGNQQ
ncbi:hypothetical protein R1sor_022173 [Riccia sorocarpa]|uniref:Transmembrane protein n=1 Tax=Riccia sorocarpa TaxID=122646 RepID=A0ABD3GJ31_9MARC